ncbi:MAG: DUF72 domain-containing protein [Gemmatimonadota bacterium]
MKIWTGTSGFSYGAWRGAFYPADLPASEMLAYYASRLPAVEINNTFYRMPRESVLESWASQVPDGFRFALKAPRRITHFKRLQDTHEEIDYFVRTASTLADRAGVILYQLPPNFPRDLERLRAFVGGLPNPGRSAFEFRHSSWFDDEVFEILRGRNAALCVAETDDSSDPPFVVTADWGYLRLRRAEYSEDDLGAWAARIRASPWKGAYAFFKHEEAGVGPRLAQRLRERVDA